MYRFGGVFPALLLLAVGMSGTANAAITFTIDPSDVMYTPDGGSFTVSAADPAASPATLTNFNLELLFSNIMGITPGNLQITASTPAAGLNDPIGSDPNPPAPYDPIPQIITEGENLFRFYNGSLSMTSTFQPVVTFSFVDLDGTFDVNADGFTVAIGSGTQANDAAGSSPVAGDPVVVGVPEPGSLLALTGLAVGCGLRRRYTSKRRTDTAA